MKPARVLPVLVVLAVALATFLRLHYGIDFSDESYYVAMARRFALGDRPLIDEFSPHQSAALLPALLVWLRGRFVPGTEGLVLYTRLLYFGFGLLIWRELYRSLCEPFGPQAALLAGGLFTAFIPFNANTQLNSSEGTTAIGMLQSSFWQDRIQTIFGGSRD